MPRIGKPAKPEDASQPVPSAEDVAAAPADNQVETIDQTVETNEPTAETSSEETESDPEPEPTQPLTEEIVSSPSQEAIPEVAFMRAADFNLNDEATSSLDVGNETDQTIVELVAVAPAKTRHSFTFETEDGPVTVPLDRIPVHCVPVKWALRDKEELTICESTDGVALQEDADAINRNFVQPE